MEAVLTDRLAAFEEGKGGGTGPVAYLVACYRRAMEENGRVGVLKDKEFAASLAKTLEHAREMIVSYAGMVLQHGMFLPAGANASADALLLPHMLAASSGVLPTTTSAPPRARVHLRGRADRPAWDVPDSAAPRHRRVARAGLTHVAS